MNSPQHLVLAGGSGFLGRLLARYFTAKGWTVTILTRHPQSGSEVIREVAWDGKNRGDWVRELEGARTVINLAGRSVDCRYHALNRRLIMESRVDSTRVLGEAIAACQSPPQVWLNSSTATIYRHNFGPAWDETGETGAHPDAKDAFSIEVARAWECVFSEAQTPNTRKVALRSAMVLGNYRNSVFPVLRRLTRLGLGGRMGSGKQFVSWIHELDFCRAIEWLIDREDLAGIVNLAAPNPLTNADMMRRFRELVGMPIGLPATEWMLEVGAFFLRTETELIIKSRRVVPGRLLAEGFKFQFEHLADAVRDLSEMERTSHEHAAHHG